MTIKHHANVDALADSLVARIKNPKLVFLVTTGQYSDFTVRAVFSNRAAAAAYEKYLAAQAAETEAPFELLYPRIIEMVLDTPQEELPGAWRVEITEDGEEWWEEWDNVLPTTPPKKITDQEQLVFIGYGKTKEHARRSAEQLRRETLALPFLEEE